MLKERDISQDKSVADLGRESAWFIVHSFLAILFLAVVVGVISLDHPDPDSTMPKLLATALAFLVPMIGGFIVAHVQQNHVARYVWLSGLVLFSVVCVWVLDLPTGNGLCEMCGAIEKLWRTFFSFGNGSGLMAGDGVLYGSWTPLAMIGYSVGARFGLDPSL